ncbi:hypothetical protein GCM10011584_03880 [Nocardioides phosphati]|uniref:Alkylmercury lyase n=1 Tax=Nocardioides phosphati TaxID=1867775 RepID=A0ABQ2N5C5_9ACTN|nr:alkylmercury lyase [Nocardioides phosphati]GGO84994.1 hypothetical protein GCM10011584_03880 [Nocardioides phosphati]
MKPRGEPANPVLDIRILQVSDCPFAEQLQTMLAQACEELGINSEVTVDVGNYPSPTLLVAGCDVMTGQPVEGAARCRLDLPSRQSIASALRQALHM